MNPSTRTIFTGTFDHTIDAVNRTVIPAKWRSGASEEFYVFPRDEGRLAVLTQEGVERLVTEIEASSNMSPAEKREQQQILFKSCSQLTCDKQGRITLDAKTVKHANLRNRVVLVGGGKRFEMWNPKAWERQQTEQAPKVNATLDRFGI